MSPLREESTPAFKPLNPGDGIETPVQGETPKEEMTFKPLNPGDGIETFDVSSSLMF